MDALRRIGRFSDSLLIDDVVPLPPVLGYRNKIELSFSGRRPRRLGFHRADAPSSLVDVETCAIADPRLQPLLDAARTFFLEGPGSDEPALDDPRWPVRLILRASVTRDERLIALRGPAGPFRSAAAFARAAVAADPGLVGVVRLIAGTRRRGGAAVETILGRSWITEEIDGTSFRVPAGTFLQVHPAAADRLLRFVLDRSGSPQDVLELYGGIGVLGLALARRGARATIVDADAAAMDCGADAALRHGITTARFERADVHAFLSARTEAAVPDLVLADPPRTGLGRGVAGLLSAIGAPRIALLSCDPATMARDLAELTARGYSIDGVTPFDLFPQTAHIETVTWLRQRSGSGPR
jgi:23S rRNA (uracil1939-C5)-methyltransferase